MALSLPAGYHGASMGSNCRRIHAQIASVHDNLLAICVAPRRGYQEYDRANHLLRTDICLSASCARGVKPCHLRSWPVRWYRQETKSHRVHLLWAFRQTRHRHLRLVDARRYPAHSHRDLLQRKFGSKHLREVCCSSLRAVVRELRRKRGRRIRCEIA